MTQKQVGVKDAHQPTFVGPHCTRRTAVGGQPLAVGRWLLVGADCDGWGSVDVARPQLKLAG